MIITNRKISLRLVSSNNSHYTTTAKRDDLVEDLDAPVKFSSTAARQWKAKSTRVGYERSRLWYEPYVILGSISIFLIYFGILREENDVDEELKRSLYTRIQGLEEHQLRVSLDYNREHNLDTTAIVKRLEELEKEKQAVK